MFLSHYSKGHEWTVTGFLLSLFGLCGHHCSNPVLLLLNPNKPETENTSLPVWQRKRPTRQYVFRALNVKAFIRLNHCSVVVISHKEQQNAQVFIWRCCELLLQTNFSLHTGCGRCPECRTPSTIHVKRLSTISPFFFITHKIWTGT